MPLAEQEIAKVIKSAVSASLPEWKRNYHARLCTNLQVHTKGLLFSKVDTLFPNEHPDSKKHCVDTYEPITKGSIWKAINDIARIFSNSSFSVSASEQTAALLEGNGYEGANLFGWFLTKWVENAVAADANSFCAVYPDAYVKKHGGDRVRFIRSEDLREVSPDRVVFVSLVESEVQETTEGVAISREVYADPEAQGGVNARTSVVKTYNQQVKVTVKKPVYHVFTRDYILRVWKVDEAEDEYSYDYLPLKTPGLMLPCFEAGGVELDRGIMESFVAPFIPFGNLTLLHHRNHRAVDLMFSYPRMSEVQSPCDAGCVENPTTHRHMNRGVECIKCKGTGWIAIQSPYKVYRKNIDPGGLQTSDEIKAILAADPVSFHTPEVGILTYSKDSWKEALRMAEEAVFVLTKKQSADAESAQSKRIDQEDKWSWLLGISKIYFETLRKVIQCIENDTVASPVDVSIETPTSFAIVSEGEAFEALNTIIASDAPLFVKMPQVENFVQKFISKSSPVVKALRIIKKVDPLVYNSNREIQTFKSNNIIRSEAWTTHVFAFPVLMQLYEQDKQLFDKDENTIVSQLTDAIAELAPAPEADLKTLLLKVA